MENPGWYTPYTPYQAEIAQGRLESLLNFQTMVTDLTGMEVANASLLDEATAAAEAMTLLHRVRRRSRRQGTRSAVPGQRPLLPADDRRAAVARRAARHRPAGRPDRRDDVRRRRVRRAAAVSGRARARCRICAPFIARAHEAGVLVAVGTDLLALALLTPPGEMGADVVFGNSQRFGVPLGYGGPHAAFFATRQRLRAPDARAASSACRWTRTASTAYRMALATREQHIRREKATSNICTAQALLANMAAMYAVYHGPDGLRAIAGARARAWRALLERSLERLGLRAAQRALLRHAARRRARPASRPSAQRRWRAGINFRYIDDRTVGIALNETVDHRRRRATSSTSFAALDAGRRTAIVRAADGVLALHGGRRSAGAAAPHERRS